MFNGYRQSVAVAALVVSAVVAGCSHPNPAVGTWSGSAQSPIMPGQSLSGTLTLTPDGTGNLTLLGENRSVTWKADDKKITVTLSSPVGQAAGGAKIMSFVALLSDDNKTLTVAFASFAFNMTRQADAAAK